jgi:hypothetical protein
LVEWDLRLGLLNLWEERRKGLDEVEEAYYIPQIVRRQLLLWIEAIAHSYGAATFFEKGTLTATHLGGLLRKNLTDVEMKENTLKI